MIDLDFSSNADALVAILLAVRDSRSDICVSGVLPPDLPPEGGSHNEALRRSHEQLLLIDGASS